MRDKQWTLTREYCGYAKPRWVLRFCDSWIGSYASKREAQQNRAARVTLYRRHLETGDLSAAARLQQA
jgi:hypothetical protein